MFFLYLFLLVLPPESLPKYHKNSFKTPPNIPKTSANQPKNRFEETGIIIILFQVIMGPLITFKTLIIQKIQEKIKKNREMSLYYLIKPFKGPYYLLIIIPDIRTNRTKKHKEQYGKMKVMRVLLLSTLKL